MGTNQAGEVNVSDVEWGVGMGLYQLNLPAGDFSILCQSFTPQVSTYHAAVFRGTTQGRGYGGGGGEWDRVTTFVFSHICFLVVCLVGWLVVCMFVCLVVYMLVMVAAVESRTG